MSLRPNLALPLGQAATEAINPVANRPSGRCWLLTQPPEEILNHTYEYTVREDILMALENNDISSEQATALLKSPTPLGDVFKEFENRETGYMEQLNKLGF